MSELEDFIAESHGIQLHRKMVLKAFSHVQEGPLLDVLYKMTRPPLRLKTAKNAKNAKAADASATPVKIVRKGMVDYRRELHGYHEF